MVRLLSVAVITLFTLGTYAQNNCQVAYQYTLGLCPNIWFFSNIPAEDTAAVDFLWAFGDGGSSTAANPQHLYTASGFYEVCLTTSWNGCTSTYCDRISVPCIEDFSCHAGFTYYSPSCGEYNFWSNSFSTGTFNYDHIWSFGDGTGSNDQGSFHVYSENGEYEVCVTILDENGCTDTYCETIIIGCFPNPPVCEVNFQYTLGACPTIFFFGGTSVPPPGTVVDWQWDFGDGSGTGPDPTHTYSENGTYAVCLVATMPDGCVAERCESIIINCIPTYEIAFQYTLANCPAVEFFGAATTPPPADLDWNWSFGDGSTGTGPNPTHTYSSNGTYTVCLVTTDPFGCVAEYCETITINCIPTACAAFFQYTLGLCPEILFFGNTNTTPGPVDWLWDFGDGATSTDQNPSHTYTSNGVYTVCLTITTSDGCAEDRCETITINCIQDCAVSFDYDLMDCPEVQFTGAVTSPPPSSVTDWQWSFGDGTSGTGPNPVHTYASNGTYTVCLTVTDPFGCTATYCESISISCISPVCEAYFQYTLGNCPAVSFFDGSFASPGDVTNWFWTFGDGGSSIIQNPVYTYVVNDNYEVCLTISSSDFCSATYCNIIPVECVISGVEEAFGGKVEVYPNPVSSIAFIKFDEPQSEINWTLSGIDGKQFNLGSVRHQSIFEVDLSHLATGVYFLTIELQGLSGTVKLIRE